MTTSKNFSKITSKLNLQPILKKPVYEIGVGSSWHCHNACERCSSLGGGMESELFFFS
jgi:hypothetical protein